MDNQLLSGFLSGKGIFVPAGASDPDVLKAIGDALDSRSSFPALTSTATPGGFVEPLLGCDPANVTPARAGAVFSKYAKDMSDAEGCDISEAWQKAKLLKPELHARMMAAAPGTESALANSAPARAIAPLSTKPFTALAFHLPATVPDDIYQAAWVANGNQSISADPKKTFMAIVVYVAKTQNLSMAAARHQVQSDYPDLTKAAGQTRDV